MYKEMDREMLNFLMVNTDYSDIFNLYPQLLWYDVYFHVPLTDSNLFRSHSNIQKHLKNSRK